VAYFVAQSNGAAKIGHIVDRTPFISQMDPAGEAPRISGRRRDRVTEPQQLRNRTALKKLRSQLAMIRRHYSGARLELWAQDETRLGLVPVLRRVWAEKGKRPIAVNQRHYEWLYVYGFVHPSSGRVEWLLLSSVDTDLFQLVLDYSEVC
jgi:hypothetical protein